MILTEINKLIKEKKHKKQLNNWNTAWTKQMSKHEFMLVWGKTRKHMDPTEFLKMPQKADTQKDILGQNIRKNN